MNFLEVLYVVTAICASGALFFWIRARGAGADEQRHRRSARWLAAVAAICAVTAAGLHRYLTPGIASNMTTEIEQLNVAWNDAWLRKDVAAVERMMASDYIYIAPNGLVMDRQRILKIIRSPTYRLHNGTRTVASVKQLGSDAIAVVHRWQGSGTFEGRPFVDDHRCTRVWARQGGHWQVVLEQCVAIVDGNG